LTNLQRLAEALDPTCCTFVGRLSAAEVRREMNQARLLVLPSVRARSGDAEGLPNVAVEAAAMGLPVVGYAHGGICEAVVNQETGLLVREGDWKALAKQCEKLIAAEQLWDDMSRRSRERAVAHFDLVRRSAILENIYDRVLNDSHSKGGQAVRRVTNRLRDE
jgi:colanic acid/amylovoran biosynthesis glycosyltransferase